jgi:methylenetetrahydrofolate--tRNA-(uracil-5-)-methyltransferase
MNVNFGLFPPIAAATQAKRGLKGLDRKRALAARALADLDLWLSRPTSVAAE